MSEAWRDVVGEIVSLCAAGKSQKSVAERFGVSQPAVSLIVQGKNWAHLRTGSNARGV